eukprot:Lankesteria_metandrocarpae@DN4452_c0_g1_i2.p1
MQTCCLFIALGTVGDVLPLFSICRSAAAHTASAIGGGSQLIIKSILSCLLELSCPPASSESPTTARIGSHSTIRPENIHVNDVLYLFATHNTLWTRLGLSSNGTDNGSYNKISEHVRFGYVPLDIPPVPSEHVTATADHIAVCDAVAKSMVDHNISALHCVCFNLFAVVGWHVADKFNAARIVLSPCSPPRQMPIAFEAAFKEENADVYTHLKSRKHLQTTPMLLFDSTLTRKQRIGVLTAEFDGEMSWSDIRLWMWRICLTDFDAVREYLGLPRCIFDQAYNIMSEGDTVIDSDIANDDGCSSLRTYRIPRGQLNVFLMSEDLIDGHLRSYMEDECAFYISQYPSMSHMPQAKIFSVNLYTDAHMAACLMAAHDTATADGSDRDKLYLCSDERTMGAVLVAAVTVVDGDYRHSSSNDSSVLLGCSVDELLSVWISERPSKFVYVSFGSMSDESIGLAPRGIRIATMLSGLLAAEDICVHCSKKAPTSVPQHLHVDAEGCIDFVTRPTNEVVVDGDSAVLHNVKFLVHDTTATSNSTESTLLTQSMLDRYSVNTARVLLIQGFVNIKHFISRDDCVGVICHGGAGTVQTAVLHLKERSRMPCQVWQRGSNTYYPRFPLMVLPFMFDQESWGGTVGHMKLGFVASGDVTTAFVLGPCDLPHKPMATLCGCGRCASFRQVVNGVVHIFKNC